MNFTNSYVISCPPADITLILRIASAALFAVIATVTVYYGKRFYYNSAISPNIHFYNVVARYRSQPRYKNVDRKVNDRDARIDVLREFEILD